MRWICLCALVGCASSHAVTPIRYPNEPPVTVVDDRRDVPKRPAANRLLNEYDFYQRGFAAPIIDLLAVRRPGRALGVNAVDEVPDSTWFTNRIGVREVTPDEIRTGPLLDEGPEFHTPWTVTSGKTGTEPGFMIKDARGVKYLVKFDERDFPEAESGAHVIVNRLLWACGYNVPQDEIVFVAERDLVIAPDATITVRGRKQRLERAELTRRLANAWRGPDGKLRVLASRWLDGESLGGPPISGVRDDDRNDRIPHERRRDLRGQYPIFGWVDHVDLAQSNFLDMWVADPRDPRRHYVVHYAIDFGKSLGVMATTNRYLRDGHAYAWDYTDLGRSLLGFGIAPRPWGKYFAPRLTGVAPAFVAAGFDPGAWRPRYPYQPFDDADARDLFWGAKLVGRFSRAQIQAAVDAARFSDPLAAAYITDTLAARQRQIEAIFYARVNPLDGFSATGAGLCFDDLALRARLARAGETTYELASFDARGAPVGTIAVPANATTSTTCTGRVWTSNARDGYTIVRVTTRRPHYAGTTFVYVARAPASQTWRVIGLVRD